MGERDRAFAVAACRRAQIIGSQRGAERNPGVGGSVETSGNRLVEADRQTTVAGHGGPVALRCPDSPCDRPAAGALAQGHPCTPGACRSRSERDRERKRRSDGEEESPSHTLILARSGSPLLLLSGVARVSTGGRDGVGPTNAASPGGRCDVRRFRAPPPCPRSSQSPLSSLASTIFSPQGSES